MSVAINVIIIISLSIDGGSDHLLVEALPLPTYEEVLGDYILMAFRSNYN